MIHVIDLMLKLQEESRSPELAAGDTHGNHKDGNHKDGNHNDGSRWLPRSAGGLMLND